MMDTLVRFVLLSFFISLALDVYPQSYWSKRYDFAGGNDQGTLISLYRDSMAVIQTRGFCNYNTRDCSGLIAIDSKGELLWRAIVYDTLTTNYDEAFFIKSDSIYLNLNYIGDVADTLNSRIQVIDTDGRLSSHRNYTYPGYSTIRVARGLSASVGRSCVTFGYINDTLNYPREMTRIFDNNWDLIYEKSVPNSPSLPFVRNSEACCTRDNGMAIAYSARNNDDDFSATIERYDSLGELMWRTLLPHIGGWPSNTIKLEECKDGGFIGLWEFDTTALNITAIPTLIFKLRSTGEVQWERIDLSEQVQLFDVFEGNGGDIYACGIAEEWKWGQVEEEYSVGYLLKLSSDGEFIWDRRISDATDGAYHCFFNSGAQFSSGDLMFTGSIIDSIYGFKEDKTPRNIWVVKLDSLGCLSPGCADWQYIVSTRDLSIERTFPVFNITPNPAKEYIYVSSRIDAVINKGDHTLRIYDLSGREILSKEFNPYEVLEVATSSLLSGPMVISIWNEGRQIQAEIVLIE